MADLDTDVSERIPERVVVALAVLHADEGAAVLPDTIRPTGLAVDAGDADALEQDRSAIERQGGDVVQALRIWDLRDPATMGRIAAERTVRREGCPLPRHSMPVLSAMEIMCACVDWQLETCHMPQLFENEATMTDTDHDAERKGRVLLETPFLTHGR